MVKYLKYSLILFLLLSFFTPTVEANLKNFSGWESGTSGEVNTTGGTFSIQTSIFRTDTYALRTNPAFGATGFNSFRGIGNNATQNLNFGDNNIYSSFYFYIGTAPTSTSEEIYSTETSTGTHKGAVHLDSAGKLAIWDSAVLSVATSTNTLSTATWYRLDILFGAGVAANYEVSIYTNTGTLIESMTGTFNSPTSNAIAIFGKRNNRNGRSIDVYYDDVWIDNASFKGVHQVSSIIATANGSTMDWTAGTGASDYTQVDEIPPVGADYVKSNFVAGSVALFSMSDTSAEGITGTVSAVKSHSRMREDAATSSAYTVRIRANGTNSDSGTAVNGNTTTDDYFRILTADPSDAGAWSLADIDAIEVGTVEANAVATRNEFTTMSVDYVPAAAAASSAPPQESIIYSED